MPATMLELDARGKVHELLVGQTGVDAARNDAGEKPGLPGDRLDGRLDPALGLLAAHEVRLIAEVDEVEEAVRGLVHGGSDEQAHEEVHDREELTRRFTIERSLAWPSAESASRSISP